MTEAAQQAAWEEHQPGQGVHAFVQHEASQQDEEEEEQPGNGVSDDQATPDGAHAPEQAHRQLVAQEQGEHVPKEPAAARCHPHTQACLVISACVVCHWAGYRGGVPALGGGLCSGVLVIPCVTEQQSCHLVTWPWQLPQTRSCCWLPDCAWHG